MSRAACLLLLAAGCSAGPLQIELPADVLAPSYRTLVLALSHGADTQAVVIDRASSADDAIPALAPRLEGYEGDGARYLLFAYEASAAELELAPGAVSAAGPTRPAPTPDVSRSYDVASGEAWVQGPSALEGLVLPASRAPLDCEALVTTPITVPEARYDFREIVATGAASALILGSVEGRAALFTVTRAAEGFRLSAPREARGFGVFNSAAFDGERVWATDRDGALLLAGTDGSTIARGRAIRVAATPGGRIFGIDLGGVFELVGTSTLPRRIATTGFPNIRPELAYDSQLSAFDEGRMMLKLLTVADPEESAAYALDGGAWRQEPQPSDDPNPFVDVSIDESDAYALTARTLHRRTFAAWTPLSTTRLRFVRVQSYGEGRFALSGNTGYLELRPRGGDVAMACVPALGTTRYVNRFALTPDRRALFFVDNRGQNDLEPLLRHLTIPE